MHTSVLECRVEWKAELEQHALTAEVRSPSGQLLFRGLAAKVTSSVSSPILPVVESGSDRHCPMLCAAQHYSDQLVACQKSPKLYSCLTKSKAQPPVQMIE